MVSSSLINQEKATFQAITKPGDLPDTNNETTARAITPAADNPRTEVAPTSTLDHSKNEGIITEQQEILPTYSSLYTEHNKNQLLNLISEELNQWINEGSDSGLIHIGAIHKLLKRKSRYLQQYTDTRLLLALFELVFTNNQWINLSTKQLNFLKLKIDQMVNKTIDTKRLSGLIDEIHLSKINILDATSSYEET